MPLTADGLVELEVERVKYGTEAALLVVIDGVDYWVPRLQVHDGGSVTRSSHGGDSGTMLVSQWWATTRGLE